MSEALGESTPLRRIEDVPRPRSGKAIRGFYCGQRVFFWQIETEKEYYCRDCGKLLMADLPHTFIRFLFSDRKGYDHHHVHNHCARQNWLPALGEETVEVIPMRHVPLKVRRRGRR